MRLFSAISLSLVMAGLVAQPALAQCMLANPSFELTGSGGAVFAGWNQFGIVGSSTDATHGFYAAKVTGPNLGGWDVSGYWQSLDTAPGERWAASVKGWHSATNPLVGQSKAILNIEWRDGGDNLISFESYTVADAFTPVDEIQEFYVESGPAPSGTATTHLLLGVLQGPTDPVPDAYFDEATFYNLGPPSLDDVQWDDFPGGRTLAFSGRTWRVKGPGYYGPGPSLFCDDPACTWVDGEGRLHMTIQRISGSWYSTEITLADALGYGDYVFTTVGRLDELDPNAVLGLFIWQYGQCYDPENIWWNPYNEIDIEISRWDSTSNDIGQFVAQPYDYPGNIDRFDATFSQDEITSHAFEWLPDRVEFRSWRGGPEDEAPENMIHAWTYTGPHIPRPEQPRVHINLWQFNGPPSTDQEVVMDEFTFVPEGGGAGLPGDTPVSALSRLSQAAPNPFSIMTTFGYNIKEGGIAEIVVYDVLGRSVRTLVSGFVRAGGHHVMWDGRDDSGRRVAPGAYLYQLRAENVVETKKVVLIQ
jgi:hypothetical protein